MDVISFCSKLVKCKSVTPFNDGAIECISEMLSSVGFKTEILTFESKDKTNVVKNLFAKYGDSNKKILGFLGHSDVVPDGDNWDVPPFSAVQRDGFLIGRGVADMKGSIAAFCCAAAQFIQQTFEGTIEFFISGDEEVGSLEGTQSLIKWAAENDYIPDDCLIGEPSSEFFLGDRIYLGHRGSINVNVKSIGQQGHVAYPSSYINSLSTLCRYIANMYGYQWKHENKMFPKTNLEVTLLSTNNYATNVVPELSSANINIRFSGDYTSEDLKAIIKQEAKNFDGLFFDFSVSGEAYYCDDYRLKDLLSSSIFEVTGIRPTFSASGGTSDGRYMIHHCNVIEFGLLDSTIHQKNEKSKIEDIKSLEEIYFSFLKRYFCL